MRQRLIQFALVSAGAAGAFLVLNKDDIPEHEPVTLIHRDDQTVVSKQTAAASAPANIMASDLKPNDNFQTNNPVCDDLSDKLNPNSPNKTVDPADKLFRLIEAWQIVSDVSSAHCQPVNRNILADDIRSTAKALLKEQKALQNDPALAGHKRLEVLFTMRQIINLTDRYSEQVSDGVLRELGYDGVKGYNADRVRAAQNIAQTIANELAKTYGPNFERLPVAPKNDEAYLVLRNQYEDLLGAIHVGELMQNDPLWVFARKLDDILHPPSEVSWMPRLEPLG